MFRIRLASGAEADYGSVAELAQGIRSGQIPGNSEIFHRTSQRWLPISAHPAWDEAAPRPEEATSLSDGLAQPRPGEPVWGKTVRIYQMYSQSGREIAERRRPTWIAPVVSLCAGSVLVAALAVATAPTMRVPDGVVRPTTGHLRVPGYAPPLTLTTTTSRNWPDAPYTLAERMARTADSAARALTRSFRQLGLTGMLAPERLRSPDSLQSGREALRAFRILLDEYRTTREGLSAAYDDSATVLVTSGTWTGTDQREWNLRVIRPDPPAEQARADSVLTLYDQLFSVLLEEAGSYSWEPGGIQFKTPEDGNSYGRIRNTLEGFVTTRDPLGERLSTPLLLLLPTPADTIPPAVFAATR